MDVTVHLCQEHDLILRVLERLEALLERARNAGTLRCRDARPFVEFFRGFTVGAHFSKEEHGLFPLLHACGVPRHGSPLTALQREHDAVRQVVAELAEDVDRIEQDADARERFVRGGVRLIGMLREHIARADHCAFGMAARLLRDADPGKVDQAYRKAELRVAGPPEVQRWRALGEALARGESPAADAPVAQD